jgi:hypothetical protein
LKKFVLIVHDDIRSRRDVIRGLRRSVFGGLLPGYRHPTCAGCFTMPKPCGSAAP